MLDGEAVPPIPIFLRFMDPPDSAPPSAFTATNLRRARLKLFFAISAGLIVGRSLPGPLPLPVRALAGWDAAALLLVVLAWSVIARATAKETRMRAASEDPGRHVVLGIMLVSSAISVVASIVVVQYARQLEGLARTLHMVLCLGTVLCSWLLTHTAYTLHYAHLYYRRGHGGEGGLDFPGRLPPDDYDFAYYAFTVGMCFQVADVVCVSRRIRRTTLGHAVLSFFYNSVILALALNLVFGLVS